MSFGGAGGSQGVIRYALVVEDQQATQKLNTFKTNLNSVGTSTNTLNKNMGALGNNFKGVSGGLTKQNTLFGQTIQQQKSLGQSIRDNTSKFAGLATGLSATASGALSLAAGFRDYNDAQIAVDRVTRKLSLAQEALGKAQDKLVALQKAGVTSGKDYEQAQLDVSQAQAQLEIQTQLLGEAQERMFDSQTQFVASVVPTVLGAVGTLGSAFKDFGGSFTKLKGLLPAVATAFTGLTGAMDGATLSANGLKGALIGISGPLAGLIVGLTLGQSVTNAMTQQQNALEEALGTTLIKMSEGERAWLSLNRAIGTISDADRKRLEAWEKQAKILEEMPAKIRAVVPLQEQFLGLKPETIEKIKSMVKDTAELKEIVTALGTESEDTGESIAKTTSWVDKMARSLNVMNDVLDYQPWNKVESAADEASISYLNAAKAANKVAEAQGNINRAKSYQSFKEIASAADELTETIYELNPLVATTNETLVSQAKSLGMAEVELSTYTATEKTATGEVQDFNEGLSSNIINLQKQANNFQLGANSMVNWNMKIAEGVKNAGELVLSVENTVAVSIGLKQELDRLAKSGSGTAKMLTDLQQEYGLTAKETLEVASNTEGMGEILENVADKMNSKISPAVNELTTSLRGLSDKELKNKLKDMKIGKFEGADDFKRGVKDSLDSIKDFGDGAEHFENIVTQINATKFEGLDNEDLEKGVDGMVKAFDRMKKEDAEIGKLEGFRTMLDNIGTVEEWEQRQTSIELFNKAIADNDLTDAEVDAINYAKAQEDLAIAQAKTNTATEDGTKATTEYIDPLDKQARQIVQITSNVDTQTKAYNLQARAVRGLTSDFNELVLIMQKMADIKGQGGNGKTGFTSVFAEAPDPNNPFYTGPKGDSGIPISPFPKSDKTTPIPETTVLTVDNTKAIKAIDVVAKRIDSLSRIPAFISLLNQKAIKVTDVVAKRINSLTSIQPSISLQNKKAIRVVDVVANRIQGLENITPHITVHVGLSGPGVPYIKKAQHGMHETLQSDTLILAHKNERVDIGPGNGTSGGGGGGGTGTIVVNLTNVLQDREMTRTFRREMGRDIYRFGPT